MGDDKIMDPQKKKLLIIIGVVFSIIVVVLIIVAIIFRVNEQSDPNINPTVTTYTDPYSGETISTVENKAPEDSLSGNNIVYFGFAKLVQYGMTSVQVAALKDYIFQYSHSREDSNQSKIKEVTVDYSTYRQILNEKVSGKSVEFTIVMNRDENLRYKFVNSSKLTRDLNTIIYSNDGAEVFNSATYVNSDDTAH
ncbi:MAG: hypothetical protein V4611_02105 [Patescibacteria group bacterium]